MDLKEQTARPLLPEWKRLQELQPPPAKPLFVSKRVWRDDKTGELMTWKTGKTAKHAKPDIFKPTKTLSKRQARKFRKATQKLVRPVEAGDIGFAD